jgi:hypothetical protein
MKAPSLIQLTSVLATVAVLSQVRLQAQSWQTVLDFQLVPGQFSDGFSLAADGVGNVFAGGYGSTAGGSHGLVLQTDTTSAIWDLSDDTNPSPGQDSSVVFGVSVDPAGDAYSTGWLTLPCSKKSCPASSWYVRKSANSGASWSTVDLFQYSAGQGAIAYGSAADSAGNIYVAGEASDAKRIGHWIVRNSANGGGTWATVDDVKGATTSLYATIHFVPGLGLFVVGNGTAANSVNCWLVRRSLDGGHTWTTVDSYQLTAGLESYARGVSSDNQGNVYVIGYGHDSLGIAEWILRKSSDGGATWTTVDDFSYVAGKASAGHGLGKDSTGNIVAVGSVQDSQGSVHWLVRRPNSLGVWQTADDYQLVAGQFAEADGAVTDASGNLLVIGHANNAISSHWIVRRTNP